MYVFVTVMDTFFSLKLENHSEGYGTRPFERFDRMHCRDLISHFLPCLPSRRQSRQSDVRRGHVSAVAIDTLSDSLLVSLIFRILYQCLEHCTRLQINRESPMIRKQKRKFDQTIKREKKRSTKPLTLLHLQIQTSL